MPGTQDEGRRAGGPAMTLKGMTLIELMIALAIVAILASLAWPAFTEQMRSGRRIDAVSALYRLQLDQERYRSLHHHYAGSLADLGWETQDDDSAPSTDGYYLIHLDAADAATFSARAQPRPGDRQVGDRCELFVINESGPDLNASSAPACWRR